MNNPVQNVFPEARSASKGRKHCLKTAFFYFLNFNQLEQLHENRLFFRPENPDKSKIEKKNMELYNQIKSLKFCPF